MTIVKHMRRDAARLTTLGLAAGMAAVCAGGPCKADGIGSSTLSSSSSLGQAIFAPVAPPESSQPILSPDAQKAVAAVAAVAPARHESLASAAAPGAEPAHAAGGAQPWSASAKVVLSQSAPLAFGFPLPGHAVNSRFGLRQLSFEPRARMHDGVDIAAPVGTQIHAAANGVVTRTGLSSSYGNFVEVAHADGMTTFYAHMSRTAGLKPGAAVSEGDVLGLVGSTGHSTGPHLHFEVRRAGEPLNPQDFMGRQFASAADLPITQARAPSLLAGVKRSLHMLASFHVRGHWRSSVHYAALHHYRGRTARG
jgi:hypothetical protein